MDDAFSFIDIDGFSVSDVNARYLNSRGRRILDVLGAVVGLILGVPLLIIAAPIIRFIDHVPVIFSQPRFGLNGSAFILHKLKTLNINETAEMLTTEKMERKLLEDPALTRTGRFWRTTSIDEIPQFWNVLRGDMSLVGYRPFPYYYTHKLYELPGLSVHEIDIYLKSIAKFKPGITSLSSVKGRSKLKLQEKMHYDLEYARGASLYYDLIILARTIVVVLTREGAW